MSLCYVMLDENEQIHEVFEGVTDSSQYLTKFLTHLPNKVFCRREMAVVRTGHRVSCTNWYRGCPAWTDYKEWGNGPPDALTWQAVTAIPNSLHLMEMLA